MRLAFLLLVGCFAAPPPTMRPSPAPSASHVDNDEHRYTSPVAARGTITGTVRLAKTQRPIQYASAVAGGPCIASSRELPATETDEDGRFELAVPEGTCGVSVTKQYAQVLVDDIVVRADHPATVDLILDDDAATRHAGISHECPHLHRMAPESGGASAADIEAIASTVLERLVAYPNTMTGAANLSGQVDVVMTILMSSAPLTRSIFPSNPRFTFVARSKDFLRANAKRSPGKRIKYLEFVSIDSDGACALVTAGYGHSRDTDVYEKQGDSWSFIRRVGGMDLD